MKLACSVGQCIVRASASDSMTTDGSRGPGPVTRHARRVTRRHASNSVRRTQSTFVSGAYRSSSRFSPALKATFATLLSPAPSTLTTVPAPNVVC